jgi:hypothetical protein
MEVLMPWAEFCALIAPHYPKVGNGRPPVGLERMLRMYCIANWFNLFFAEVEWTGAYVLNKKKPPKQPPPVRDVVRLIAQLGGFLARKGDGEPGVKSLWLGMIRLRDFALTVEHMRMLGHET